MPAITRPAREPASAPMAARAPSLPLALMLILTVMLIMATAMACAPEPTPSPVTQPTPTASRAPTVPAATPTLPKPPGGAYTAALEAAQKALATRLAIPLAEIRLVSSEPVDWPDTSLGCPKEGMAYAQVITPGFRLVLGAGQATYEYHSDYTGHVVTCK